jgi:hypothetical protein
MVKMKKRMEAAGIDELLSDIQGQLDEWFAEKGWEPHEETEDE